MGPKRSSAAPVPPPAADDADGLPGYARRIEWLIRILPAMKYALGALALMLGVAITIRQFGLTGRTALFGGFIGLAFMIAVFLFSEFTKSRGPHRSLMSKVMVGVFLFLLLAAAVFGTASAFFGWPIDLRGWLEAPRLAALRQEEDARLVPAIDEMRAHGDYRNAFDRIDARMKAGPLTPVLRAARARVAMDWTRDLTFAVGKGENLTVATTPLIAAMREGMGDVDRGTQADLRAHLAWAGHLRNTEAYWWDQYPRPAFDEAFALDPGNVYAHTFAGAWVARTGRGYEDNGETPAAQAARHFALAIATGRERAFVRDRQLAQFGPFDVGDGLARLRVLDEMRRGGEPRPAFEVGDFNTFLYSKYKLGSADAAKIESTLPPADFLKTLQWVEAYREPNQAALLLRGRLNELAGDRGAAVRYYLTVGTNQFTVQESEVVRKAIRRCKPSGAELHAVLHDLLAADATQATAVTELAEWVDDRKAVADDLVALLRRDKLSENLRLSQLADLLAAVADEAVGRVGDLLADPNPAVRRRAANVLRAAKQVPSAVAKFAPLLRDDDLDVRLAAYAAVAEAGESGKPLVPDLLRLLGTERTPGVRADIARALVVGAPDDPAAVQALTALLHEGRPDLYVQMAAGRTLAAYGPRAAGAVPWLAALAEEGDDWLAKAVCEALSAIGPDARAAIPNLIRAADAPKVRPHAARAILAIAAKLAEAGDGESIPVLETACYALDQKGSDPKLAASLRQLVTDLRAKRDRAAVTSR